MKCGCGAEEVQTLPIDKDNHTGNTHIENKVEPTCGKDGYTGDTVCECGVTIAQGEVDPATGKHNYATEVEGSRIPATCKAEGSVTMKCGCGATEVQTLAIDKDNHTGNTHIENKVEPTCGAAGYTGDTVCECGVTIAQGQVDPATGKHSWSDWTVTQNPTTTAEGVKERSCSGCGDVETDNIPKLNEVTMPESNGGDVVVDNETPATGDEVTVTVTPDIGKEVDQIIVKDENGNEIEVTKNEDGTYTYEQPEGDVTVEVIFKDREYDVEIIEPKGGLVAVDVESPKMGDEVIITIIPDAGKEVEKVIVKDADGKEIQLVKIEISTFARTGSNSVSYSFIYPASDVSIEVIFRDVEFDVEVPESNGGDVVVDNEAPIMGEEVTITVTPDSGMKVDKIVVKDEEGNEIPVKDNSDGTYTYEQPAGNVTIEVTFAKKETTSKPNWMSWLDKFFGWGQKCEHAYATKVVAPTCDCKGYTVYTCSKCGDSYKDNYTNALGHAWDAGKVTKEATCTENGVKTFTCGNCGKTKTETIKATGHDYQDGICNNCGSKEPSKPTPPNKPNKPNKPGWGNIWDWIGAWWK